MSFNPALLTEALQGEMRAELARRSLTIADLAAAAKPPAAASTWAARLTARTINLDTLASFADALDLDPVALLTAARDRVARPAR
jgi:hypothetical protein